MNSEISATIFDIKHFALHDGPGIRTTIFFKGCPLDCRWCHNPEGINDDRELMIYPRRCSEECHECIELCPRGTISRIDGTISIRRENCLLCGICQDACMFDAIRIVGRRVTVGELMGEIEDDRIFFEQSGGGVTFSGGEPLMQFQFLETLAHELKREHIHTALDTSGYSSRDNIIRIAGKVDLILYDFKFIYDRNHIKYNGVSNRIIKDNLKTLNTMDVNLVVRLPLIGGINDTDQNIGETARFLDKLDRINRVELLPYHQGGNHKSSRLGRETSERFGAPTPDRIKEIEGILKEYGLRVKVGG